MRSMTRAALATLALAGALGGCTVGGEVPSPAAAPAPVEDPKRPVTGAIAIDLGRTFDGYMLTATATADAVGWSGGELRQRGVAPDGFLDIDFVALPPAAEALIAEAATPRPASARRVVAFTQLTLADLQPLAGVRVRGRDGTTTVAFTR